MGDTDSNKEVKKVEHNEIKYATHEPGVYVTEPHDKEYMEMSLKGGNHSPLVQKILRQRIEARAKEFPRWPSSQSGGVRIMWLESRFWYDRERLGPDFDDDWRAYRVKYLKSLELDPREPVHVPEYELDCINPIRRFYQKGGDLIESGLKKVFKLNHYESQTYRITISRLFMAYLGMCSLYYFTRYTHRRWFDRDGPVIWQTKPVVYPDDPRWPYEEPHKKPSDWNSRGFERRTIFEDLDQFKTTHYPM